MSFVDTEVSFWRPGAEGWVAARLNTALAPGDELYTGSPGNLEIQIGGRAYVRAWARTQIGLTTLESDFVQVKVTTGFVALDLRRLDPGQTIEVDTPNAAFTIDRPGYYRVDVTATRTSFITRRAGRATVTTANGTAAAVASSEEVIVEGVDTPQVLTYVAPKRDVWDRWNHARTEALLDSMSARYVSPDVYGIDDLDQHGSWRVVETYGAVWVPTGVPADWVPYSTGSWVWDPFYGWTWVDSAPWGWAPYHYGRWVFVSGFWAWDPGPTVVKPVYAPALVAFFGLRAGVSIGVAVPPVGWVALGWGEPVIPWWGPAGFVGTPRWAGWGGPRVVNNVVIGRTTVVHVDEIHVYRNAGVRNAIIAVPHERFGRGPVAGARATVDPSRLEPLRGKVDVGPTRASLAPDAVRGVPLPDSAFRRPVIGTRAPEDPTRWLTPHGIPGAPRAPAAPPRLVPAPSRPSGVESPQRPPFGASRIERPRAAPPPRPERAQPPSGSPAGPAPKVSREAPRTSQPGATAPTPQPAPRPGVAPQPPRPDRRPAAPTPSQAPAPSPRVTAPRE